MDSSDSCLENTPPSIKETAENVISNVNTPFGDVELILEARTESLCLNYRLFKPDTSHLCTLYNLNQVEDMVHFICVCPILTPYRLKMEQCVFIIDDRTQSMPIQSVVDVEAISSSTSIISTAPAADVHRR
uniref:Uncharacterized protein n=1 Tax=Rhodnius prolixus TaxID=13249 RepID=T1HTK3_RHOPR